MCKVRDCVRILELQVPNSNVAGNVAKICMYQAVRHFELIFLSILYNK